jgi:hypothetical protein
LEILMTSFWLLLLVSTLNVLLGYALAAFLGYAPPSLRDAWIALADDRTSSNAPYAATSTEAPGPQDRLAETDPVGLAAEESPVDRNGIEFSIASVEYGGGAT